MLSCKWWNTPQEIINLFLSQGSPFPLYLVCPQKPRSSLVLDKSQIKVSGWLQITCGVSCDMTVSVENDGTL